MYIVSYHAIHSLAINFYIISWSLFILNARFRIPSTPDISSPHISSQRKLIGKLTGPTPDFFRCNASFNQPKIPGWKDHIVINPNLSAFGPGEDLLHLAPKHLLLCPSLSMCECISEMFSEAVQGVLIDRPQIVFFLAWRADFSFVSHHSKEPSKIYKEEEEEEAVQGQ